MAEGGWFGKANQCWYCLSRKLVVSWSRLVEYLQLSVNFVQRQLESVKDEKGKFGLVKTNDHQSLNGLSLLRRIVDGVG